MGSLDCSNSPAKSVSSRNAINNTEMLLYRSRQRGFLELDLVLGKWVEEHINLMDMDELKALSVVLDSENPDLWNWLTGKEEPPEAMSVNSVFSAVRNEIVNSLSNYSAIETRAKPGQNWVEGWN